MVRSARFWTGSDRTMAIGISPHMRRLRTTPQSQARSSSCSRIQTVRCPRMISPGMWGLPRKRPIRTVSGHAPIRRCPRQSPAMVRGQRTRTYWPPYRRNARFGCATPPPSRMRNRALPQWLSVSRQRIGPGHHAFGVRPPCIGVSCDFRGRGGAETSAQRRVRREPADGSPHRVRFGRIEQ